MEFIIFTFVQAVWFGAISWKFYVAADRKAWEAFIPIYNTYVLVKIAHRPTYWVLLYCIPVVGVVMGIIMIYELLHVFKFRKTWQTAAVMATFGLYLGYLNYQERLKFWGRDDDYIKKNLGEGVNSIFFAVVVATVIRSTTFEAYTIPTSSMEKSLMVGDFLFVSKMHYGVRIPMTPISVPLIHNKIPFTDLNSYSEWPQIPYLRLPSFSPVKSGDPVVFNWPADPHHTSIDKKENYVKRCIGTPGDSLEIVNRMVFINNDMFEFPDRSYPKYLYYFKTDGRGFDKKWLKENLDVNYLTEQEESKYPDDQDVNNRIFDWIERPSDEFIVSLQERHYETVLNLENVLNGWPIEQARAETPLDNTFPRGLIKTQGFLASNPVFPNPDTGHGQRINSDTWDNLGPIYIPKKGVTVSLNETNIYSYHKVISEYEGHDLRVSKDGIVKIDGNVATEYTFEKDYYWMMGDNRHNSADSRDWGYVPEDHIVGKPVFIWMSYDKHGEGLKKIRADRVFTTVNGEGERTSYFWHFIAVVLLYQVVLFFRRRKKT